MRNRASFIATKTVAAISILIGAANQVHAGGGMSIKGLSLGMDEQVACKDAVGESKKLDDLVAALAADHPRVKPTGITDCNVDVSTIAGVTVLAPVRLRFIHGKLGRALIDMGELNPPAQAQLIQALRSQYGAPTIRRSNPFTTIEWHKNKDRLTVTRVSKNDDVDEVELALEDVDLSRRIQQAIEHNTKVLEQDRKRAAGSDVR